ncbi:FMN-dependent NADH-azoreductase [Alkalicaulis satelles]|uniref:FMN dependent NADH:quinone oxidoreductase n=1 Tax=Alkalicaulis satelles TaxID=2609175 RepID=A0A5M6ZJI6_9PROT|nr:NAD(P)H-dependent oxidoreductase [Alkalicaulis satelles]KAA5804972.1 FMN-dependent NADH-azoreductase [Alkalicaulis satelles]
MVKILHVASSARLEDSVSRELGGRLAAALAGAEGEIVLRDLARDPAGVVDSAWVAANFTAPEARTDSHAALLAGSDVLVAELKHADHIVIGAPMYNFSIPAPLKAWIDQVARARETFRYSEAGPEGLLKGKTAWLVVASGGVPVDGEADFVTPYLRHVLGFMGINDVRVIDASRWMFRTEAERAQVLDSAGAVGARAAA